MKKSTKIILSLTLIGGIGFIIWYLLNGDKSEQELKEEHDKEVEQAKEDGTKPPPSPQETDAPFDLNIGWKGRNVIELQKKLGVVPTSGFLGSITKSAIEANGYSLPLSKSDYDNLMAGKTRVKPITPSDAKNKWIGKPVWARENTPAFKDRLLNVILKRWNKGYYLGTVKEVGEVKGEYFADIYRQVPNVGTVRTGLVPTKRLSFTDPKKL